MGSDLSRYVFLTNLASSLGMVGIIWFVQLVHYPLLRRLGEVENSSRGETDGPLARWAFGLPMLLEGVSTIWLAWFQPDLFDSWQMSVGLGALVLIWVSTVILQIPLRRSLTREFNPKIYRRLVATNWIRTICWSLRGILLLGISFQLFDLNKGMPMAKIKPGDLAPKFSAKTFDGTSVNLVDYIGHRGVVLFFYPKDGTAICTKEACAFRDSYEKFTKAGFEVIGVSSDSEESHRSFSQQHHLSFPLISDADGSLRKEFGVTKTLGLIPGRVTYVIDQQGVVRHVFSAQFASDEHVQQALNAILDTK